ncbi:MAG: dTDP-glucose 4,6-dehydratase [Bacillota bacterium]
MRVILITGGAGFIGSNFIRYFLRRNKDFVIVNIDNLNYASNLNNLKDVERSPRYHFVKGSICNHELVNYVIKRHRPDYIINLAAESDSDRSVNSPLVFSQTNILGTLTLLESARYFWGKHKFEGNRFIHVSTDEVYGGTTSKEEFFTEESALLPGNPYSASKASADLLVRSFYKTYGFPSIITRCCENFGPYQHIERLIPYCIKNALQDKPILLNEDSSDTREWIHVLDHCVALIRAMFYGKTGEIYNIGSGNEMSNFDVARKVLMLMGKPEDAVTISKDTPIHDKRCALNSYKLRNNLNWGTKFNIEDGLKDTIYWYKANPDWWEQHIE